MPNSAVALTANCNESRRPEKPLPQGEKAGFSRGLAERALPNDGDAPTEFLKGCHRREIPFDVALCFGAQASPGLLAEDQLAAATEAAFQRLIASVDGFQPLLCEIWKNCPSSRGGYYSNFGNLWRWLLTV